MDPLSPAAEQVRTRRRHRLRCLLLALLCVGVSGCDGQQGSRPGQSPAGPGALISSEHYCIALYGPNPGGPRVCPSRLGQCEDFQDAARSRLLAQWVNVPQAVRASCIESAYVSFLTDLNKPSVNARAVANGSTRGYALDLVEQCVMSRLHRQPAPVWLSEPPPPACLASGRKPPEATKDPQAICEELFSETQSAARFNCVAEEQQAQAQLESQWKDIPDSLSAACTEEIRGRAAELGRPTADPWRYKSFAECIAQARAHDS